MSSNLLVIDDEPLNCKLIKAIFGPEGFTVAAAADGPTGLDAVKTSTPDVVLLDLRLPGMDGLSVLEKLKQMDPGLPVIMLTAHREVKSAVKATQLGAFDYLTKPIDHEELLLAVRRAVETRSLRKEVSLLRRQVKDSDGLGAQMGSSAQSLSVIDQVGTVAGTDYTVLVVGETGTGKELVAQAIHRQSDRSTGPFIALDCGAIPENLLESELFGHERGAFTGADRRKPGQFQLAEGGTLFLDEIGNLPINLQMKLLRVLESKQFQAVGATRTHPMNIRFVAATNFDLQEQAARGSFRADLYFRLAQYTISLPALRDRFEDIPYLAQRFLKEASIELRKPVQSVHGDAIDLLTAHSWPGNVRELRNVIRQAVLHAKGTVIDKAALRSLLVRTKKQNHKREGGPLAPGKTLKQHAEEAAREAERVAICETLRLTRGNKSQAAKSLQTDYKTLHLKMKSLGIRARDFIP